MDFVRPYLESAMDWIADNLFQPEFLAPVALLFVVWVFLVDDEDSSDPRVQKRRREEEEYERERRRKAEEHYRRNREYGPGFGSGGNNGDW